MNQINSYIKFLPAVAVAISLSACTFEQEDFFDESAALRIEHTNDEIKSILCSASADGQHGWLIQYFVGGTSTMDFEGFNLYARFYESGKVTLASDHRYLRNGHANKYTEYSSIYEMLKEEGSVLSFSTWNDVITPFVDPVNPSMAPNILVGDGVGMNGDDRLVMVSYNKDEMVFRGERYGAMVYFSRLDRTPEQYALDVKELIGNIANDRVTEYKLTNRDTTVYIANLNRGYFDLRDRLDDPLQETTHSCVFTPNGFMLQHNLVLGNDTCSVFNLNADATSLVSGNTTLIPYWGRPLQKWCNSSKVLVTAENACASLTQKLTLLNNDVKAAFSSQELKGFTFGKSNEAGGKSRAGIVFLVSTSKTTYQVGFTASVIIDPDQNTATIAADINDASSNYANYEKKGLGADFTQIVDALNGSYKLTTDKPFNPTSVVWTKENDPDFYFVTTINN